MTSALDLSPAAPGGDRLGDLLARTTDRLPEKVAFVAGDDYVTWQAFDQRVDRLATAFLELGIRRGDRIGIVSMVRPEYLSTYLAAARIGAVLVGFNPLYTAAELQHLAELVQPAVVVVAPGETAAAAVALFSGLAGVRQVLTSGDVAGGRRFADAIAEAVPGPALVRRRAEGTADDGLLIVFTSGSTGRPKAALLSHRNVHASAAVEVRELGLGEDDRILLHLPLFHVGGATELVVPALLTGATLVLLESFHPLATLRLVERQRLTLLGQVPTMFVMELGLPELPTFDLGSLRTVAVAGAATPAAVMQRLGTLAPRVLTGYGLTEAAGFVTYTRPGDDAATLATTVGRPVPEFPLRIVDAARRELPAGSLGEVAVRGACVMQGYFGDPAASAETVDAAGWLYTGDLGYLDKRGYLVLGERKKEIFITGGYNVSPREIEEHLARHPAVGLVACIGRPHPVLGEVGAAFVALRDGCEASVDELLAHCRAGLAEYKVPRTLALRTALPLTALGKVDKPELRRQLREEDGG